MIMNRKNPIYGTVTQPEDKNKYTGVQTDTATVTVNNVERTIAVDVDFKDLLGSTHDKAYPGNLGAQNRALVINAARATEEQGKELVAVESRLRKELYTEIQEADSAVRVTQQALTEEQQRAIAIEQALQAQVTSINDTYADKLYVQQQLAEYSKLSKQIVDQVDLEQNKIIVDGNVKHPVDGILYLVQDESQTGETTYKQYTTIDGKLTLIGDTRIDLSDYATLDYVAEQIDAIPEVDLSDYAKKSELPDVSEFLSAIPPEYITEGELTEELDDYATKSYVAAELAKVGSLTKKVVDSIDVTNNTVTIEGVLYAAEPGVVYLVLEKETEGIYQQYTLIDGELLFIGDTNIDLKGYATEFYVDTKILETKNYVDAQVNELEAFIQGLKFIDGGTSTSIQYK